MSSKDLFAAARIAVLLLAAFAAAGPRAPAAAAAAASEPEFGGQCAMSLAEGQHVATDCSVKWVGPDGKTYCFGDADAKKRFLKDPQGNLDRAREYVAVSEVEATGKSMDHYKSEDVQDFVKGVITQKAAANGGVFPFTDPVTGQELKLVFDKVDFVRTLHGYGFFPDVVFHAEDNPAKKY